MQLAGMLRRRHKAAKNKAARGKRINRQAGAGAKMKAGVTWRQNMAAGEASGGGRQPKMTVVTAWRWRQLMAEKRGVVVAYGVSSMKKGEMTTGIKGGVINVAVAVT